MPSWIFQVNPTKFDIDAFFAARPKDTRWLVRQHAKEIAIGDEVFIWRAIAGGDPALAGIIAKAYVTGKPSIGPDDPNAVSFWRSDADRDSRAMRVDIRIESIASKDGLVRREKVIGDKALRELSIIRMAQGTNYPVTPEQAERLDALWASADKILVSAGSRPHTNYWRMAMRVGENGYEMWDECLELGVAAITYEEIGETDFSNLSVEQASSVWANLAVSQKASIRRLAYEMRSGDVIYVKQGPKIVGKGIIRGPVGQRAYAFNIAARRLIDPNDGPWLQQVPVAWMTDFMPIEITVGSNQRYAIQPLSDEDVRRLEDESASAAFEDAAQPPANDDVTLSNESYLRATTAQLKFISRRHNGLSNAFAEWLKLNHATVAARERNQVDVQFQLAGKSVLVELKICFGVGSRHAIREALGQLLEYNYYPARRPHDVWLVVLDKGPSSDDKRYVDMLRAERRLPLFLGWQADDGFLFHPRWP